MLASRSPQRSAILAQLGVEFEVCPADIPEETSGPPAEVVSGNALNKARTVSRTLADASRVLGADTAVVLDGRIYGKPRDVSEARSQIELLSGRSHDVWSAVALLEGGMEHVSSVCTAVTFRQLDQQTIEWYLASSEWRGRAGSYAIQGKGAALVERIEGDYWNVVGLPVATLLELQPGLLA